MTDTFDLDFAIKDIEYGVGYFNLGQDLLIEYSHAINDVTKNKTAEVLSSKNLSFAENTNNTNSDSNFLVGTVGEDCAAFEFIDTAGKLDGDTLAKADGYQIYVTADKLAILGHDNSACYFAMTTMQDIFNEIVGVKLRCFDASDYPELATRGVIEGFYGQP
ncbi:MAG: glycoside hydrolase family 20 zincin-like fold domain-containing protein [Coriobacteriia bacterium]|nr:glycoside hydrolase family 20 zincin-like fold domain-containing protein [Coriobacteriia bacterium]